jgi:multiple sugar transport system substrate-binding protein
MKERIVRVWVAVLMLCFNGCARQPAPAETRIVVALPQWFYPSEERPWLQGVWEELRRAHPGVALDLQLMPGRTEQVLQKLLVSRAAGDGPDLACVRLQWAGELLRHRILLPMEGVVPEKIFQGRVPSLGSTADRDGAHYLLPYDVGVRVILYRADLFQKSGVPEPRMGWNREDLVRAAQALTVDRDRDGTTDQWGFGLPGARHEKTIFQWLPWFWSLGGEFREEKGGPPQLRTPAAVAAMQWYRDLARRDRVTPPTFFSMDQAAVFEGLAGGLFAMTEGGSWEPALMEEYSRNPEQIRIAPLPSMRPGDPPVTLVDGWGFGLLTEDPDKKKVVGDILAALSSPGHQLEKYRAGRMLSPFQALYLDPLFREDPAADVLAEAVKGGRPVPDFPSFPRVQEALEISLQEVLMSDEDPGAVLDAQQKTLMTRGSSSESSDATGAAGPAPRSSPAFGRTDPPFVESGEPGGPPTARTRRHAGMPEPQESGGSGLPDPGSRAAGPLPDSCQALTGSLCMSFPEEGRKSLLAQEDLCRAERVPVGDLKLVPLASLLPREAVGDLVIRAADGFEKRLPPSQVRAAFLDPERMTVHLVHATGAKSFTIRDVTELLVEGRKGAGGLVVIAGTGRRDFSTAELRAMAGGGVLRFRDFVSGTRLESPAGATVRLIAEDGYTREVRADDFLKGEMDLESMRCSFPGLPSRDQVSGLARIEIP